MTAYEVSLFVHKVFLLQAQAEKGTVTDEIAEWGRKLHFQLKEIKDQSLLSHPNIKHLRSVLALYHDVSGIILYLKMRWRDMIVDERKKSLFKNLPKRVVEDYQYFAENGTNALIGTQVKIPNVLLSPESFSFGYFPLIIYFTSKLIEELFIALLEQGINPKDYQKAFVGVQKRFCGTDETGNRIMEAVLEKAKKKAK